MRASITDSKWRAWNQPNEGWTNFLYTDDAPPSAAFPNGIPTIGMGNAVESIAAAQALPFVSPDGSLTDAATIAAQWQAVHDGPANSSTGAGYLTTMRLPDAAIEVLIDDTIAANEQILRPYFPGWDTLPADAQAAIMSMAWAMGPGFAGTFGNFDAAINRGDYDGAIAAHAYRGVGTQKRQAQELAALANAKAVAAGQGDPAVFYWPGTVSSSPLAGVASTARSFGLPVVVVAAGAFFFRDDVSAALERAWKWVTR